MKQAVIEVDRELFHQMMRKLSPHHLSEHLPEGQFQEMRRIAAKIADATAIQNDGTVKIVVEG